MKPHISIIATGSEITAGRSFDTNSGWIANELFSLGWKVRQFLAFPDDPEIIYNSLEEFKKTALASQIPQLVIMTGGLGPTDDDYTLETVLKLENTQSRIVEKARIRLEAIYKSRGKSYEDILSSVLRQTQIPETSLVLENGVGIAPGFAVEWGDHSLFVCMPGVPSEMKEIFQKRLLPLLKRKFSLGNYFQETRWIWNMGESLFQSQFIPQVGDLMQKGLEWGVTAQRGFIKVIFQSQEKVLAVEAADRLTQKYGRFLTLDVFQAIHENFIKTKQTLVVAESCTGGGLGKKITELSGSSAYFLGGFLTYSNESKQRFLGVSEALLTSYGAVSEEVARAMAEGARERTDSDYAIAITGIAGPEGGLNEKPVGTVWIAVSKKNGTTHAEKFRFPGNRESVRDCAANTGLFLLHEMMMGS